MARKGQGIEILSGWQGGIGGEDFIRQLVERTVQQVLEAEMSSFLGAETYERNGDRRGWRNGVKPRTLKTRVGELELMVPKDRGRRVPDGVVRALPAQRKGVCRGPAADVR